MKILGIVVLIGLLILLIGPIITMFFWESVIPDVAPGLIQSGAIATHLSWWVAFKLNVLMTVLFYCFSGWKK